MSGSGARVAHELALTAQQIGYQNRIFRRTPVAAFFTLAFPLILLVLFDALFSGSIDVPDGTVSVAQFYAPGLAVFAAATATYTNLATQLSIARDDGILKRVRGTPMPPWLYMAGQIGNAILVAAGAVVLMIAVGGLAYDLQVRAEAIPAVVIAFVVGVASFAALGLAVAALIPNGNAAPAVTNATILPLAFVSNVFIPLQNPPAWIEIVGAVFPLKPFVEAFSRPFLPGASGFGVEWAELGVVAAWGVGAGVLAALRFRWEPNART